LGSSLHFFIQLAVYFLHLVVLILTLVQLNLPVFH